jgi:hypothetical protein
MINYNIGSLFDIAFGIRTIGVYDVGEVDTKPQNVNFNYSGMKIIKSPHEAARMSYLGTPIILPMTLQGKKYQVFNEVGDVVLKQFENFEMPAATLVSMRRAKIMTETKARASKGSVIEMYGFEAWRIDIRGFCLADPSHATAKTAYEQKLKLYDYDNIVDSIKVLSDVFNDLDINNIAIKEISFNQLKGKPGVIPFYMQCRSDEPLELIL